MCLVVSFKNSIKCPRCLVVFYGVSWCLVVSCDMSHNVLKEFVNVL